MRIQLNRQKLTAVNDLIQYLLKEFPAGDEAEALVDDHIKNIKKKFENRISTINIKNSFCITLSEEEAKAYFSYLQQLTPMIPKTFYVLEQKASQEILNLIDETYGTIETRKITGTIAGAVG